MDFIYPLSQSQKADGGRRAGVSGEHEPTSPNLLRYNRWATSRRHMYSTLGLSISLRDIEDSCKYAGRLSHSSTFPCRPEDIILRRDDAQNMHNVINGFFDTNVSGGKELQFHLVEDSGAGRQQQAAAVA